METSTGAQNDLQRATDISRRMVTEFGMSWTDDRSKIQFGPSTVDPFERETTFLQSPARATAFTSFVDVLLQAKAADSGPVVQSAPEPKNEPAFFYIKSDRQFIKILLEDVLYIESLRNHIKIVTTAGNHTTLLGISQMEEKLPPQHFIRIHRSFIVSLSKVTRFSQSSLMAGEKALAIGQNFREEVLKRLEANLI